MSYFHITLHRSAIGLPQRTRDALAALGLRRRSQAVVHAVSPSVAGLVFRVKELVRVREVTAAEVEAATGSGSGSAPAPSSPAAADATDATAKLRGRLRARALDGAAAAAAYSTAASSLRVPAPGYVVLRRYDGARRAAKAAEPAEAGSADSGAP